MHLVTKSPFTSSELHNCLRIADSEAPVVLIGDACYAIHHPLITSRTHDAGFYALVDDLHERGLQSAETVTLIDYDALVKLTESHKSICTWG